MHVDEVPRLRGFHRAFDHNVQRAHMCGISASVFPTLLENRKA